MERILVIEDEPSIAQGLYRNLKFEGNSVQAAPDGDEGLTTAVDNTPDLVLLDVMLPKMNGFEVLREIHRLELEIPSPRSGGTTTQVPTVHSITS